MARQRNVVAYIQGDSARVGSGCPVAGQAIEGHSPASRALFRSSTLYRASRPSPPPEGLTGRVRQQSFSGGCGSLSFAATFGFVYKALLQLAVGGISDLPSVAFVKSLR